MLARFVPGRGEGSVNTRFVFVTTAASTTFLPRGNCCHEFCVYLVCVFVLPLPACISIIHIYIYASLRVYGSGVF